MNPPVDLMTVFISELVGTAVLITLGVGVVANVVLPKTKGNSGGWIVIAFGWGLGVFAGVIASQPSGAHINPAVTIGLLANGSPEYAPGVAVSVASTLVYIVAQVLGAMIGATAAWMAHKKHYDEEADPIGKRDTFCTTPAIHAPIWNFITEVIGTWVLVFIVIAAGTIGDAEVPTPAGLGWLSALGVALLVVAIGLSLGGPTGYAINPARDLGPRIMHAVLPIPGKTGGNWGYAWVPVVGPLVGGALAGLSAAALL